MSKKKTPMRKCVASQEMKPKNELLRVVRTPDGDVMVDLTGKKSGRGAYLSKDKTIIEKAKKKNILSRHLKAEVDDALYDECIAIAEKDNRPL